MLRYTLLSCNIRLRQGSAFKEIRYENILHPSAIKMSYRIKKEGLDVNSNLLSYYYAQKC
jgi:hypothetical protein